MSSCILCGKQNMDGADLCESCGQPLSDMHLPPPATIVERSLLRDHVRTLEPRRKVITVAPDRPVGEVIDLLVQHKIGCVVVEEQGRPVGVFSERDALRKINVDIAAMERQPVSEFMTPQPETLDEDAKIAFAVQRMDLGSFRHVPIVDQQGELAGIISVRDILRYLTDRMASGK